MNVSASAALQLRSIRALMLRRIRTRYIGTRAGYIWAFIEVLAWVFILKLVFAHSAGARAPLGTSHEVFFMNGLVLARTARMAIGQLQNITHRPNKRLVPTINRLDQAIALWLVEFCTGGVALVIGLSVLGILGFDVVPAHPLTCIIAFAAAAVFALGCGLTLGLIFTVAPGLAHFKQIIDMIIWFSSGFTILLDRAPPGVRKFFIWNPLTHCMELYREGFYAGYECRSMNLTYLVCATAVVLVVGLMGERAFRRHAERTTV